MRSMDVRQRVSRAQFNTQFLQFLFDKTEPCQPLGGPTEVEKCGVWMQGHGDRVVREGGGWGHPSKNQAPWLGLC